MLLFFLPLWDIKAKREEYSPTCEVCLRRRHYLRKELSYIYGDSSYRWCSMAEDSEAASSPNNSSFDDDGDDGELSESGPSRKNRQRDSSPFGDFSEPVELDETSCTQHEEEESVLSSEEHGWDEDFRPRKPTPKLSDPSFTSKNYCYVCGKGFSKISRHLLIHADIEPEIAEASALPLNSKERKRVFDTFRNRGNYKHNQEVLKNNHGALKLKRRPTNAHASASSHVYCLYCKGMLQRKEIWRHVAKCPFKPNSEKDGTARVLTEIALAESPYCQKLPSGVLKLLLSMKQDEVAFAIQNDFLLIQLAQSLCDKYLNETNKHEFIRKRLREMGRLLIRLQEESIYSFEDAIKPKNFHKVIETVKNLAGFHEMTRCYRTPGLAVKMGYSLKRIGSIILAGTDVSERVKRDTKTFMRLCSKEWTDIICHTAAPCGPKVKNPSTIPFTRDMQVFYNYLEATSASAIENMKTGESQEVYTALCRVTLAQASVLNKCAPEVSKMTLKTFQERDDTTKVLSKNFMRMNILSSRTGENVAILLTSELVSAMTLLVTKREACGVNKDNPFLFAKPNSSHTSHYHGGHCIRPFLRLCCAKNPAHLRSVHHHKHVARVFQILNLENDELRHLAKLLGHEIRPDREYYRLPEAALELAKIAKLLLEMEKGSLERFKGNTLEEIEIEDELEPDGEQYDSENSDGEEDEEDSDLQQSDVVEQQAVKKKQKRQLTPEQDAEEHIKAGRDKSFLEEMFIDHQKGRGVFTRESIEPSTFVVEYRGNLLLNKESGKSKRGDTLKNYLYDFSWDGKNWRIDASNEDGTLGRLVNDNHKSPNCKMKKLVYKGKPHLCLFAVKKISADEEITYNYGNTAYPWRSAESGGSQMNQNDAASSSDSESFEDAADSSAESCSDDEYKPDCDPSSDESCTSTYTPPPKRSKKDPDSDSSKRRRFEQRPTNASFTRQEHWVKSDHSSDDDFSSDGDEVEFKDPTHTNKNYCYVCGKAMIKLSRHLFTHRKQEPDIAEAFALRPGSKERFALLDKFRNKGNLKHNEEVMKTNRGELKVKRKMSNQFTGIQTFAQCLYCKGMYSRRIMWRHMQKCSLKKTKETKCKKQRKIKVLTLVAAAESTDLVSSQLMNLEEIIKKLKNDEIASVVKNDAHILQLAQCLYHVNKGKKMQENVTYRLKLLGRLMLTLQKKSISSFEDALKPQNFSHVIDAVKELSGFNEELKTSHSPTLMMKLMTTLKTIGEITYARALKDNADKQKIREAETFMKLCDKGWRRLRPTRSKLSASTVPFIQDVQLLRQYMEITASSGVHSLTMYGCSPVYIALLRVTVAQLSILNKNMMEVSRVTVKSFNERDNTERHGDTAEPQPQLEQILSKHYVRLKLVCNKGKEVVAVMTPQLISALSLLVSKRESCGVHANNPFLFGRPSASCTSFFYGHQCMGTCVIRCGAKNTTNLRSVFFHQHIERVFQILSLSDDELAQLAKLLGRNIRTDTEYYRTPEAALDIAKILEILAAMENGSLERLEGKSLEEIEVPDILEPDGQPNVEPNEVSDVEADEEQENPENLDAEKDLKLSELSLQLSGLFSFSTPKKANRVSSSRKRGKSKTRKQASEAEPSELNDERNNEVNSEQADDEMPESCDVDTPEKTVETAEDASKMWFSDDDDGMNVDFDIDTDDDVRNEDNDRGGDTSRSAAIPWIPVEQDTTKHDNDSSDTKKNDSPPNMDTAVSDHEDRKKDVDEVNKEEKDQKSISNTEKKKKLLAAMKNVKIVVRRLDTGTLRFPVHVSKLSSVCNSDSEKKRSKQLHAKDQTVHEDCNKSATPSTSSKLKDQPSSAKEVQMICSHCKKSMLKGQTAYQKKGFTDVFCSKNCLFALFPLNKPVTKTCHQCHQAISQPLDVIMAAVDIKGTMKEFCGINCLCAFKYNTVPTQPTQTICRTCKKTCTTTCDFTLFDVLHKFCSDSCLQDFRRENMVACANCNSTCQHKPLALKLDGEETKTICSDECLEEFKEKITKPHKCHVCQSPQPVPVMVHYKSEENVVELLCNRYCLSSYKTYLGCKIKENKSSAQSKEGKRDEQSSEDGKVASDSTVNENADAESEESLIVLAKSGVQCGQCRKELQSGQRLYQPKTSQEVFCSASCLSEWYPQLKVVQKKCHNCFQVILRPHDMILAPVDDSGTMKELCSNTCLASVNSKRNLSIPKPTGRRSECRMCGRYNWCRFELILDGLRYRLCSDACYIRYHKVNNMPVFKCNMCGSICHETRLVLTTEDGSKTVCSEECLVKLKKKTEEARLCPMCQTLHQVSDMVESKSKEGKLELFCSNRCMMVHKAQSATAPGRNSPTMDETDVKEVKPSLANLDCIKQEPVEEECNQNLSSSIPAENIKDEPNVAKEDLRIGSVFSLKGEPKATALTQDLPASCSNCKNVLMDGETVYQRKGRADIFCSTSCLLKFYQMKQAMKTCHFCLQVITQLQGVIQAPVDNEETMKDFCSETCLTSFNYKKIVSTKTPAAPVGSQSQCTICSRYSTSKHEIVQHDVVHKICSDPCFLRFCNVNKLSICESCCSHCSTPVVLKMGEISKKFCSVKCLSQFKQKYKTPQPCAMCCTPHVMTDMVENKNGENEVELFCTNSCVMASKIQAVSASGRPLNCDNCGKSAVPACHLAMSDASIRNFCTLSCAMVFKETQTATVNSTGASDQTQSDFLKPPEKLLCAQCRRILKTVPKVVQKKGKMNFVCSLACSQEFKRVNNIMGKCEYCKNEKIIRDIKRVDGRDCYFCSDGCKMLFRHELEQEWGVHCSSCAYCMSISKTLVTAKYKGADEKFCSEDCNSKYKMLFCHIAKCDTCGHEGKLRQSLPLLGEVKHFCDLKCVLHFCNKKVQTVNADSSPPRPAGTTESSPVIANVISLAGALARQTSASVSSAPQTLHSVPDIQTKVVGHASVQTVPKELKNKSMLCTPLVHNKGVSCTPQTVDTEAQTDNFVPKVVVLPLPVPVYVPMPMNMYSQYTPKPVGLPLPLPVPVFLPGTAKETTQPDPPEEELDSKSEDEESDKEDVQKERAVTRKRQRKERTSDRSDESDVDQEDDSSSDSSFGSLGRRNANEEPPLALEAGVPGELPPPAAPGLVMREDLQRSQSPAQASPSSHHENKARKLPHLSKAAEDETSQRDFSTAVSREYHKLNSQCGIDAWKRWIQWRELQINLDLVSSHAVAVKEDVLRCSAAELNDGLCCFITEVKRPDGEPYSPDSLFYLCLSIQQYLFENGRMENIFSDLIYNKFSVGFTEILKGFRPSVTGSGYSHSCVEEEFLWECKQLGAYSPIVLLNTLLFFCCKHFGFSTVEQHRQLSFTRVMHCTKTNQDNSETNFLRFYVPISINEAESDVDGVPAKRRKKRESEYDVLEMMENTENPLRCPVRLYEFYLSKCSESVKQRAGLFYLQPDRCCVPGSPLWFSSTALDSSTMEAMLVRILAVRELQGEDGRGLDQRD